MTAAQKTFIEVQKRQSTLRGEFNTLRGVETRSAEQDTRLTALDGELTDSETEFRTAADALLTEQTTTTAPGGEDTEAREKRELCVKANVGDVINSILEKRGATDGATHEAQQAFDLPPNMIPLDMLRAPVEVRAVTPTPGASQTEQAETVQPVFANGAGNFLGIDRPTVPQGTAVYPVLTSRPTVGGPHVGSDDVGDTTGAFSADLLPPKRIQASFIYRRTDAMQFSGMDSALRMALNGGLQEKLDYEAIGGTSGLLTSTNLPDHDVSAVTSFANYLSRFLYGRVDGRYAEQKKRYPRPDGRADLCTRGLRLSVQRIQVGARGARRGFRRRARVSACASGGEQETGFGGPARDAAGHGSADMGSDHDCCGRSDPER